MNKEELQLETLKLIETTTNRILFNWCTSLGKSKMAILSLNKISKLLNKKLNVLLVVAEVPHKKNWQDEFNKWGNTNKIISTCYASLHKFENTKWDAIIYDEAHHLQSDLRLNYIKNIKSDNVILLSATITKDILWKIELVYGKFITSNYTLDMAIKNKILPKPVIYLIPLEFKNVDRKCTIEESWGLKHKQIKINCLYKDRWTYMKNKKKYPNISLTISCTPAEKYLYLSEKFEYYKRMYMTSYKEAVKFKWLKAGADRKRFLGEMKAEFVFPLLNTLKDKRFICFCSSVEQADLFGGSKFSIHSRKKNSLQIIDNFNMKKINKLFAVDMLQEGQNLKDIQAGIIVQLGNKEGAFIQKFGRTCRADSPMQFIYYFKNTRDEEFVNECLKNIDRNYIVEIDNIKTFKL